MTDEENCLFDYFGMFVEDKHPFAEDTNSFDHFDSNDNRLIDKSLIGKLFFGNIFYLMYKFYKIIRR